MCIPSYIMHDYYRNQGIKPFNVDVNSKTITISKEFGTLIEESTREALMQFPLKSYAEIDHFRHGIMLFVKNEKGLIEKVITEQQIAEIKSDQYFQEIAVKFQ